jgi:transposase
MLRDEKAGRMFSMLHRGHCVAEIARRLKMSERTIRKYRDEGVLPSQRTRQPRAYRTRQDPLEPFWPEIEELLREDAQLRPFALLDWLKQKYNPPAGVPGEVVIPDSIRRTLERRVQRWKLQQDVQQEVTFPQVHQPGDVIALDFVVLNALQVTIQGRPYDHMLFHAVLTYSNWEYVHLCHSESFEALATGLQDALHFAGGVPRRVRSDSLSAAVNNLSCDKTFSKRYQALLDHYGLQGHRINVRKPHENGDVESSHGHLKSWLDQALRLRGSRDFADREEYLAFLRQVVTRRNEARAVAFRKESEALERLPRQRVNPFTSTRVTVKSDCLLRIKRNTYSVSSKYIGLTMEVLIYQDHLELWYRNECLERLPRLFGQGKERIDFRHVIDSLVRKPGAFANYKYVNHLYPTTRFRMAYDQLLARNGERAAVKQYLKILHAAKHEGLDLVDDVLRWFLAEGKTIAAKEVLDSVSRRQQIPAPTDVHVESPDLGAFDSLLLHKEVYDDKATQVGQREVDRQDASIEESCLVEAQLEAYDRHVEALGAIEGTASADVPGTASRGCGAGGERGVDAHAIPLRAGDEGMPGTTPESDRTLDAELASVGGQDLGTIPVVSHSAACEAAVRDPSQRRVLGSSGQPADFWETWFREDQSVVCAGGPAGKASSIGLLHDVPAPGPGTAAREAGFAPGAVDQEAPQVRGVDHRRPGLRPAESRRDGGLVHPVVGAVRARECALEQQPTVLKMGTHLPRSHDHRCGDRPLDPSFRNHRAEHPQLSTRSRQAEQTRPAGFTRIRTWLQRTVKPNFPPASLIVAKEHS